MSLTLLGAITNSVITDTFRLKAWESKEGEIMNKSIQPDNVNCWLPENNQSWSNDITKVIFPKLVLHPLHFATINDKYNIPFFKITHCSYFKKECAVRRRVYLLISCGAGLPVPSHRGFSPWKVWKCTHGIFLPYAVSYTWILGTSYINKELTQVGNKIMPSHDLPETQIAPPIPYLTKQLSPFH